MKVFEEQGGVACTDRGNQGKEFDFILGPWHARSGEGGAQAGVGGQRRPWHTQEVEVTRWHLRRGAWAGDVT